MKEPLMRLNSTQIKKNKIVGNVLLTPLNPFSDKRRKEDGSHHEGI